MSLSIKIDKFTLPYVDIKQSVDDETIELINDAIIDAIALYCNKPISRWGEFTRSEIEEWVIYLIERAYELGKVSIIQKLIEQAGGEYTIE